MILVPMQRSTLLLRSILRRTPPCDKHTSLGALAGAGGRGEVGGRAKEGKGKGGHKKILTSLMDPSHLQEDKECNRPPCLPHPPPTAIHIEICARVLLLYIQKRRAIHIASPTLNKQIRHDNQPANLNAFSFFSSFPWRWRPLSSTNTPLALAILAAVYCCCCHAHNCNLAVLQLTPTATCQSACHYHHSILPGRHPFVNCQAYLK
jgi:hypothetical protein